MTPEEKKADRGERNRGVLEGKRRLNLIVSARAGENGGKDEECASKDADRRNASSKFLGTLDIRLQGRSIRSTIRTGRRNLRSF